jgi:hypothetical protein
MHVILDLDHFISFLRIIENPGKEKFWEIHREVARSHAEQFKNMSVEQILKRLEACNLFRLGSSGRITYLYLEAKTLKTKLRIKLS